VVRIRSASTADAAEISSVQRDSWLAAYEGIIAHEIIDRVTAPDDGARVRQVFRTRPWQRMIVAVAEGPGIVGYASFGPELDVFAPWPHPVSAAGGQGRVGELYALYVHPAWWSTGTGRALMDHVLAKVASAGYPCVMLWVLERNARARGFYERAGFRPDGASHVLAGLGGVIEIRYRRALGGGPMAAASGPNRATIGQRMPDLRRRMRQVPFEAQHEQPVLGVQRAIGVHLSASPGWSVSR
jgi:ribosomal protein S18 acetylase RimI-like enzyme